jgi:hypothetical protein
VLLGNIYANGFGVGPMAPQQPTHRSGAQVG